MKMFKLRGVFAAAAAVSLSVLPSETDVDGDIQDMTKRPFKPFSMKIKPAG